MYKDKYDLTIKENIFICKKLFTSLVYCGLKMENRNVTFPQTEVILNGVNVSGVSLDDICAILGLKRAFEVFFSSIDNTEISLELIKKFNYHIARDEALESGVIRNGKVGISGTDYIPPILSYQAVNDNLNGIILSKASTTEKAIKIFLYIIRSQIFWDGNKRTALLSANFLLVKNGKGLLNISENNMLKFAQLLNNSFNTGDETKILDFLYEKCICGMEK